MSSFENFLSTLMNEKDFPASTYLHVHTRKVFFFFLYWGGGSTYFGKDALDTTRNSQYNPQGYFALHIEPGNKVMIRMCNFLLMLAMKAESS